MYKGEDHSFLLCIILSGSAATAYVVYAPRLVRILPQVIFYLILAIPVLYCIFRLGRAIRGRIRNRRKDQSGVSDLRSEDNFSLEKQTPQPLRKSRYELT